MENKPLLLETDRLLIRAFRDKDLEDFIAYRNDPLVAEYQGWEIPYPREKALEFIEEMKNKNPVEPEGWFQAAIVIKDGGEFVGDCAFIIRKGDNSKVKVGCTIAQKFWQRGYAVEAVRRLLDFLFYDLKVRRVVAETDVENDASIGTLERLNFRREAHLVENVWFKGRWASEYHYALLDREWRARPPA